MAKDSGAKDPGQKPQGALAGLRVLEFAAIGPVPFAGMLLADMGAQIVRVAPPLERDIEGFIPHSEDPVCRGRARLTLDLKSEAGRAEFLAAAACADLVLEGFRPGVLERLGIGPEILLRANPRIVIGRMTGWGQDGECAQRAGHDPNYIGLAGVLSCLGSPDRPPPLPLNLVGDYGAGAMLLLTGVLAALLHARATGDGQVVDAAMLDGSAQLMTPIYAMQARGLWDEARGANVFDGAAPFSRTYETLDRKYVVICALEPQFYRALLEALGLCADDLPGQFDKNAWPDLSARFAAIFKTKTRDNWVRVFENLDACVTPVLSLSEAKRHPHNISRKVFEGDLPAPAPRFSHTPSAMAAMDVGDAHALLNAWSARCA